MYVRMVVISVEHCAAGRTSTAKLFRLLSIEHVVTQNIEKRTAFPRYRGTLSTGTLLHKVLIAAALIR